MKHPFWLLNSLLCILLALAGLFIFFLREKPLRTTSFAPDAPSKRESKEFTPNLAHIYDNDLFDTYKQPLAPVEPPVFGKDKLPAPPQPKPVQMPIAPPPKFLEPLAINLKGIIVVNDESANTAIIQDNKLPAGTLAKNYTVGQKIHDAQIVRIMKNKIILIRSNGQEETLYVNQLDAELDQHIASNNSWSDVIQQTPVGIHIDPAQFIKKVPSLAQLIDMLNLTTVYQQGTSIGCKIGSTPQNGLVEALGLQPGDIITTINEIPATDTTHRFEIYKTVTNLQTGEVITLELLRNNAPLNIEYTLHAIEPWLQKKSTTGRPTLPVGQTSTASPSRLPAIGPEKSAEQIQSERVTMLKQRKKFAPTAEQLRTQEKKEMLQFGQMKNGRNKNILLNATEE